MENDQRGKNMAWNYSTRSDQAKRQTHLGGKKFPLKMSTLPHYTPVSLGALDMIPLLLYIKECDGFCVSKQEVACASIKDLIAVGHLYFFGDFILQILDQKLK